MHFSLPLLPTALVIAVVLLVIVLLVGRGTRKRRRRAKGSHSSRRSWWRKLEDHGTRIAKSHGHERSPEWQRVAKEHRKREPACAACGYKGRHVQVHHVKPFHLHPDLELDPDNLITLCSARNREHHLLIGHLDAWDSYNEHVRADVKHYYRKTARQIKEDLHWQKKLAKRP